MDSIFTLIFGSTGSDEQQVIEDVEIIDEDTKAGGSGSGGGCVIA